MVVAVVIFAVATGDNASCPAVARFRGRYCVFMIITAPFDRQVPFEIAEYYAVPLVRIGSTLLDQSKRVAGFLGQIRELYFADLILSCIPREAVRCIQLQRDCDK